MRTFVKNARVVMSIISVVALFATLAMLAWLRRDPGQVDRLFDIGDVLGTHQASSLSRVDFGVGFGRLQLALLASVIAIPIVCGRSKSSRAPFLASMGAFAAVYADSITRYATTIAGHLYVRTCDDALISMRYARNFAEGRGLVYNAGEHVDGFTNPLWTAIMVIPHALGMHEGMTGMPILVLGGLLLVASAFFVRAVLIDAGAPTVVQILAPLLFVFDVSSFEFSIVGLETPLLTLGASMILAGALLRRETWLFIGIPLLTLGRADGAVVTVILLTWLVWDESAASGDRLVDVVRRRWKRFAFVFGVAGCLVAWRFAVYGHPAPNTYYLKVYALGARLRSGVTSYGMRGILLYGLPTLFVLWAAAVDPKARRARRMLVPVIAVWLYAMYIGGDAFPYMRFLGPVTPALWTAVGLAVSAGWSTRTRWTNAAIFVGLALVAPVKSERGVIGASWDRSYEIREWVVAAKTIERNVPPDARVATFFAGLPYFAPHHRFIDMLGKADSHIAHQNRIFGVVPGHNKFDFPYVYDDQKPEVTFTSMTCDQVEFLEAKPVDALEGMRHDLAPQDYQPAINQLLDPTFRDRYLAQRVVLRENDGPAGHPVGCWFIRRDSKVPIVWQVAYE